MNEQMNMNFNVPATKRNDPLSSYLAEESITASRKRHRHCWIILDAMTKNNIGLTVAELTQFVPLKEAQVQKRMIDLERKNYIRRSVIRSCRVKGSKCQEWFIV